MDLIQQAELVSHYEKRIYQLMEETDKCAGNLKIITKQIDDVWKSPAASQVLEKLQICRRYQSDLQRYLEKTREICNSMNPDLL